MRIFAGWLVAFLFLAPAAPAVEPAGAAARLIELLKMQKIPGEGCWFVQSYRSTDTLAGKELPARYAGAAHPAGTAIYALETRADFSALHRLETDEVYHWYGGSPLELLLLYPDGHGATLILGPDVAGGGQPQIVIPRGVWQGSRPLPSAGDDAYTLFGTTMSPGFESGDFHLGARAELLGAYPKFAPWITALTRE